MAIFGRLLGAKKSRRDGQRSKRRERTGSCCQRPALPLPGSDYCAPVEGPDEEEAAPPALRFRHEAIHGMDSDSRSLLPTGRKGRESTEEKRMRRMWEKQQQAMGVQAMRQTKASMNYAKRQILASTSTPDLLEKAENLIEEDWLGKIEEMPGSMYFIGAFGDLTHGDDAICSSNLNGLKDRARLVGCLIIMIIQLFGPPAVFFSTVCGWGIRKQNFYHWDKWDPTDLSNCLYDWNHVKLTKVLGILFMVMFILNGLFVILDGKQAWFKIYNIFQYLKRSTPNFELSGQFFLYLGAFINCWTVLWCCVSSYVIVGASDSPKAILFDALGILFVYNLDDIGGELGFVDEDDWPGLRLGWIHAEMVKKDWRDGDAEEPGEEVEGPPPCVKGCGRPVASGTDKNGKPFDTCCRGCARGEAHEEHCKPVAEVADDPRADRSGYVGGETTDWEIGGWIAFYGYAFTIGVLCILVFVAPVMSALTPFLLIVPQDN